MKRNNLPRDPVPKERVIEWYEDTIDEIRYRFYSDGFRTLALVLGRVDE